MQYRLWLDPRGWDPLLKTIFWRCKAFMNSQTSNSIARQEHRYWTVLQKPRITSSAKDFKLMLSTISAHCNYGVMVRVRLNSGQAWKSDEQGLDFKLVRWHSMTCSCGRVFDTICCFKACCCMFLSLVHQRTKRTAESGCTNCLCIHPFSLLHPPPSSPLSWRQRPMRRGISALLAPCVRLCCGKTWLPVNSDCSKAAGSTPVEPQNINNLPPPAVTERASAE